jgi:hypothetical protein
MRKNGRKTITLNHGKLNNEGLGTLKLEQDVAEFDVMNLSHRDPVQTLACAEIFCNSRREMSLGYRHPSIMYTAVVVPSPSRMMAKQAIHREV